MKHILKRDGAIKTIKEKFNIENLNLPARSSIFFTLTNLLCKGAAFLFTPIFTRLLSQNDYGEFSLFSTFLSISAVAVTLEISGGIIMRLFQKENKRRFLSIFSAWLISVSLAIPTVLALWLIQRRLGFGMSFPFAYLFLFLSLVSIALINLFVSHCKFLYSWVPPLLTSFMQSIVAPIIGIALLRIKFMSNANHVSVKIGAVSSVLFVTALYVAFLILKQAKLEAREQKMHFSETLTFTLSSARFLLKLALPMLPYYLSIMIISQADKLFISSFFGKGELAKYSVAYSAGVALTAITGGIMGALSPWIMRRTRAGEYSKIRGTLDTIISASIPLITIFLCFAPEFFSFLAPKEYQTALPVLFISTIIPIPLALAQCSSSIAIANERVGGVLFSGILPAILTLALNFLVIERVEVYLVAIITASGFLILAALGIVNIRKITGNYTINVNKAFQNLLFLIFLALTVYSLRDSFFVRIVIAILSSVVLALMSKPLIALLKENDK